MHVPPEVADKFFEKDFNRGAVLATEMFFSDGTTRKKYLVVLNQHPADSETLLFLTTSKVDFYEKHSGLLDCIKVEVGTLPFFPLVTIINCRQVQPMPRAELKKRFREGKLIFLGNLPQNILEKIDQIVAASRLISVRHKKAILGWK